MKVKYIITLAVVAFFLHIVWENAQAPFYAGYQSFSAHFPKCLIGAAGDTAITLFTLAFIWLFKKDKLQTAGNFPALAIIGFIIAVVIEQYGLLVGKWNYAPAMPIIPWLNIGLLPVIQMTLLLPLSFYLAGLLNKPKLAHV